MALLLPVAERCATEYIDFVEDLEAAHHYVPALQQKQLRQWAAKSVKSRFGPIPLTQRVSSLIDWDASSEAGIIWRLFKDSVRTRLQIRAVRLSEEGIEEHAWRLSEEWRLLCILQKHKRRR